MGKKRKYDDLDEDSIRRKIKKLESKLKEKYDQVISEGEIQSPFNYNMEGELELEHQVYDDTSSFYLPPSEWAGESETQVPQPIVELPRACSPDVQPAVRCSSPQPGTSTEPAPAVPVENEDKDLDDNILSILGDAPKPDFKFGEKIHKDVATRWQDILAKGLAKEVKEKLVGEYLIPANCELLVPPILNPEAKAALPETLVRRDFSLQTKQKHIAAALGALAQVMEMVISKDYTTEKLLKPISDASRLLCDSHYVETKTRRSFVISSINYNLKGALIDTSRDKYLFGENLTEKLKSAKTIQKSGDTLKNQNKTQSVKSTFNFRNSKVPNRVNTKALHHRTAGKTDAGPSRPPYRAHAGRMQPPPPPPPPPRRQRSPPPPPPPAHRAHYRR